MNERCTNDHEIAKGHKFCGECGEGPKAADRTCTKCSGSILKAHNFCPGCGEKAASADDQYTEALTTLTAFAKAQVEIAKDLKVLPTVEAKTPTTGEVQAILKAASKPVAGANGDEIGVEPEAIIIEVLKSQNVLAQKLETYAGHHQATLAHVVEGNGLLVKACLALGAMNRELGERVTALTAKVEEIGGAPRGRKGTVVSIAKGGPASNATTGDGNGGGDGDRPQLEEGDLAPSDVIMKCLTATGADDTIMSTHDFAKVTTMANGMGLTLKAMCEYDAALAPTLLATIKKADQIAAKAAAQ